MIIFVLTVFGLCFGSFINALVWRIYLLESNKNNSKHKRKRSPKDYSVIHGRSMCVYCEHDLSWKDLIPVFSWVSLSGRCRYCGHRISWQYPAVELVTALLFIASYIAWPEKIDFNFLSIFIFASWIFTLIGLVSLIVYDLKWMILPNKIVYPLIFLNIFTFFIEYLQNASTNTLINFIFSVVVASGIFWLIFQLSNGQWIGGGDVKLGILIGVLVADPYKAFMIIFLASTLGSLYSMPGVFLNKFDGKSKIPFGPFLIVATIVVYFYGSLAIEWYKSVALGIV